MRNKFIAILAFYLPSLLAVSQVDSVFVKNFGGPGDEPIGFGAGISGAPSVKATQDLEGNIYVASFTNSTSGDIESNAGSEDIFVVKTDANGELIWSKTYGGSSFDRCFSIILLSDGNLLLAGRSASNDGTFTGFLGGEDAFLIKISPAGDVIWSRLYGGSLPDTFFDVVELDGGDLIACGISGSIDGDINDDTFAGSNKAWLMRMNSSGQPVWSRITDGLINNSDWEESFWFARLNNTRDAVYLLGATYNFNDINSDDLFISKYNLDGTQSLKSSFGGQAGDTPSGLVVGANDNLFVFGSARGGNGDITNYLGGSADAWLLKLNSSAEIIWDKTFGGSDLDYGYGLSSYGNSLFLCLSTRSTNNSASAAGYGLLDGLIIEVDSAAGDTISTLRWGSSSSDYCHDLVHNSEGNFYAVGRSAGNDAWISQARGGSDLVLIQYRDETISVNEISSSGLLIYPNPSKGLLKIRIPENYAHLSIYNSTGLLVFDKSCSDALNTITLENFPKGIYTAVVTEKGGSNAISSRFILD
ncbi:MAG: T9SS type A sorting domain-containing protein [Bacteroidia bacterium]